MMGRIERIRMDTGERISLEELLAEEENCRPWEAVTSPPHRRHPRECGDPGQGPPPRVRDPGFPPARE